MHTSALSSISHTYPTVRLSAKMTGSHAKVQLILLRIIPNLSATARRE